MSSSWIDEGLATYLSGQLEDWKDGVRLNMKFSETIRSYSTAASAVDFLILVKCGSSLLLWGAPLPLNPFLAHFSTCFELSSSLRVEAVLSHGPVKVLKKKGNLSQLRTNVL